MKSIIFLVLMLVISTAHSNPYKLKGITLGDEINKACADSPIEDQQKLIDSFELENISFPSQSCKINIETVANIKTSEPVILLFWKGKLIRMIVKFESIDHAEFYEFITALMQVYGKSKNTLGLFPTSTWRNGNEELFMERTKDFPSNIGLYLTHLPSWKERESVQNKIEKIIKAKIKKSRLNDISN